MRFLTADRIRELEKQADAGGLSFSEMMDRAGRGCAEAAARIMTENGFERGSVAVLCGKGRNGGDGFVIARELIRAGYDAPVVLTHGEPSDSVCTEKYEAMKAAGAKIFSADNFAEAGKTQAVVDAVFGIGFRGELDGKTKEIFAYFCEDAVRIAVDVPSGLCVADGTASDGIFPADRVLTMIAAKYGLERYRTEIIDIGVPYGDGGAEIPSVGEIAALLPKRPADSNKGTFGRVCSYAGSYAMPGAAVFTANAAVRAGAGLVTAAFPQEAYNAVTPKLCEPVLMPVQGDANTVAGKIADLTKVSSVLAMGPGLGTDSFARNTVRALMVKTECPVVLDADGLNCIADDPEILFDTKRPVLVTPHPGEMSRLTGKSVRAINADRIGAAKEFAERFGVTVLLKGRYTVVCEPDGIPTVNPTGNSGLAKGGSGDVLTGLIAGFAAQGLGLRDAAVLGAYVHGLAGEIAAREYSEYACTPTDVLAKTGEAILEILREGK